MSVSGLVDRHWLKLRVAGVSWFLIYAYSFDYLASCHFRRKEGRIAPRVCHNRQPHFAQKTRQFGESGAIFGTRIPIAPYELEVLGQSRSQQHGYRILRLCVNPATDDVPTVHGYQSGLVYTVHECLK